MARYSKIALYKLQNEVHSIKPETLNRNFGKKIVEIPEAHAPLPNPLLKSAVPNTTDVNKVTDNKEPFVLGDIQTAPVKTKKTPIGTKKATSKKATSSVKKSVKKATSAGKKNTKSTTMATPIVIGAKKSGDKVEKNMHEMKKGTLKSGSGKKVKNRKQAIAIGLSEARKAGAKVPKASIAIGAKKSSVKKTIAKKAAPKKAMAKKTSAKIAAKKTSRKTKK